MNLIKNCRHVCVLLLIATPLLVVAEPRDDEMKNAREYSESVGEDLTPMSEAERAMFNERVKIEKDTTIEKPVSETQAEAKAELEAQKKKIQDDLAKEKVYIEQQDGHL